MTFSWKTEGYAQISDCYVHMWYICYCYCIAGHLLVALMYLKTKTLNNVIILVVFLSCFKKFKCLGDVLDSVSLWQFATLRYLAFYNSAQILI